MPTKDFRMDLRDASTPKQFTHLSRVQPGDYDGSISFDFHDSDSNTNIEFQVVVSGKWILPGPLSSDPH